MGAAPVPAPRRRAAPVRRQRDTNGALIPAAELRERAETTARRRESDRAARERWERGLAVPHRITLALDIRKLYGPDVDAACGVAEPAVDQWEEGILYPTWEQLLALAELTAFDVRFFTAPTNESNTLGPGVMFVCRRSSRNWNPVVEIPAPVLAFTPEAIAATLGGYCVACLDPRAGRQPIHTCEQTTLF